MPTSDEKPQLLIDLQNVLRRLSVCRTTLDAMVKAGEFPQPVRVRGRVLWPEAAVDKWISARFAEANTPKMRTATAKAGTSRPNSGA